MVVLRMFMRDNGWRF